MSNDDIIDDVIRGKPRLWCVELVKAYEVQILTSCVACEIGVEVHIEGWRGDNT